MAHRSQPRKSEAANPTRAAQTKALAVVGAGVVFYHPAGNVRGTISRVTDSSVYVEFRTATGPQTLRFTQRVNGEYRQTGKGQYWAPLRFDEEA